MKEEKAWEPFWPKGMPKHINYPELSVGAIIKGSANHFGEQTALVSHDQSYSYVTLYEDALRVANALRNIGVAKGDVIAVYMSNCPEYVVVYYGILLCGATFSPVNPQLKGNELAYQLIDCDARAIFTQQSNASAVHDIFSETKLESMIINDEREGKIDLPDGDHFSDSEPYYPLTMFKSFGRAAEVHVSINPKEDLAHLAYTGGTTGRPKGVMLTHYNVVVNTVQFLGWQQGLLPQMKDDELMLKMDENTTDLGEYPGSIGTGSMINLTPWYHAMGTVGYLNSPILSGTKLILHSHFDPEAYLRDAEKYQVTRIGGSPPVFFGLSQHPDFYKRDLSSVKSLASGAAPIAKALLDVLNQRFPEAVIIEAYGLTEATMGVVSNVAQRSGKRKNGTVGIPVFDTDVKIAPLNGAGTDPLPANTAGEVCIRGPQVMQGYYKRPEETEMILEDGWLRTGDIGTMDEDGFLSIVDRKKDMLIYKGYNVYPRELEEILHQHPAVAQAVVIGKPDMSAGEIPKAFVVLTSHEEISAEDIRKAINKQVAPYKKLREVEVVKEIPTSAAGKILKRVLRDREMKKPSDSQ